MSKLSNYSQNYDGFSVFEALFGAFSLIVIIGVGILLFHGHGSKTTTVASNPANVTTANPQNPYAVLSPALVASKTAECAQAISYAGEGSPTPLQCANGDLNVTAWNALSALEPKVMSLGYSPSVTQVEAAICSDANAADADSSANTSTAIETSVYQISKLYYNWDFSSDPSVVLANGTC
jgi:hypothetical protein